MAASAMVVEPKPSAEPPFPSTRSDLGQALVVDPTGTEEDDLYSRLKSLQRQLEFIDIQEEYVKDEQKNLKRELLRAQEEVKRIQSVPLVIGQFMEMVDQNNGIVGSTTGSNYYVCTAKMNLSDEVDLEDYVSRPDKISAAEIAAICQEAGMHAVRKNRYVILPKDFEKGYRTNVKKPDTDFEFYK
ncbi:AAA ATPase [Theobroma cacao]|nr:AAA ATPase [Theobroma cacao]